MTINDIAKMAGVSSAAVSRYFNNGYLSDEKKEMIRNVVEATGYRPSLSAQMLRTKKTKVIGVIIPKVDSSSMSRVIRGILGVLDESGYRMYLADTRNSPKRELEYLAALDENPVDGVIIAGTIFSAVYRKAIKKCHAPVVIVGQDLAGFNCIYHDDYHAMYELTRLFIEKGRTNLGYIGVTEKDRAVGELRYHGYCDALRDNGLTECRNNYVIADFTMETGFEKMGELYRMNPDLDAVICATDRIAVGARKWLLENEPDKVKAIALGGQGDSDMASVCEPPVTTVHYYYEESGMVAARRLMDLIEAQNDYDSAIKAVKLGFQIVDRIPQK